MCHYNGGHLGILRDDSDSEFESTFPSLRKVPGRSSSISLGDGFGPPHRSSSVFSEPAPPQPSRWCTRVLPRCTRCSRTFPAVPFSPAFASVLRPPVSTMPSGVGSEDSDSAVRLPREDVSSAKCRVCALGLRPPSTPAMPDTHLPSIDDPRATVASVLIDAAGLEHQVTRLRAHNELTAADNAGLAAHACTLHDRNCALLRRAREGFDLGAATVNGLS
ncbi:unnamed protein product [Phytophthora fragariaefolia]|uniref:Unnamed protein product n=1 Tax=Phytophthora fragariaefolia TaxID=1490495 RepID=A0A9W6XZF2_9STRA|nr:unnamed protein product [Phytophthora fragariaefolia]